MSRLKTIKAVQQAAANAEGRGDPYLTPTGKKAGQSNKPLNALQKIKRFQLADAEQQGLENPYQQRAVAETPATDNATRDLPHYQAVLEVDRGRIAAHNDIAEKAKIKQSVLPTYLPFVDDYVESGDNYPNDVAVQCMIWLFDIGEIEHALNLALHLIEQGQKMPAKFDRNMTSFVCDAVYDIANAFLKEDQGISPYLDVLVAVAEKNKWDMPVVCFSKLYSMLAKHKVREHDFEAALNLCKKAMDVNPEKHGVKGLMAEIEKALAAQKKQR